MFSSSSSATILISLGPSQSGKSSFIRSLLIDSPHRDKIMIGDGSGVSMTDMITHYDYYHPILGNLVLIDIPGLDDNRMRFTSSQIMDMINKQLFSHFTNKYQYISGIALVDSLRSDKCCLSKTVNQALQIFPKINAMKSSVVIFSHSDMLGKTESEQEAFARMQSFKGFQYMCWSSRVSDNTGRFYEVSKQLMDSQCKELKTKLASLQPIQLNAIQTLVSRIQERANYLCQNQPARTRTVYQDVVKSRTVYQSKQEVRIKKQTRLVPVQKTRKVERSKGKRVLGIFVGRKYWWQDQIYTENQKQQFDVPQHYTVQVPREQKYTESVAKQINDPLPVSDFTSKAEAQVKNEIREEVRVLIVNAQKK